MMHLNEDNKEIDVVTLMDQLSSEGSLSEAGGPQYPQNYRQTYRQRAMFNTTQILSLSMH